MRYIKSPMNYTGGKYKLLNSLFGIFPNDINVFVDLFAGSMEIPLNFKNEFGELKVLANVKDEKIETPLVLEIGKGYIYTGEIETLKKYIQME